MLHHGLVALAVSTTYPHAMKTAPIVLAAVTTAVTAVTTGCASEPEVDPLAVTNSATITDIRDNTASPYYSVSSATLESTALGTVLTLGFDIRNTNGTSFRPVSTVTFTDGTTVVCEVDDLRRVPSLVETTDTWDFACDADSFPGDARGAFVTIVD